MKRRNFLAAGLAATLPLSARAQDSVNVGLENDMWRIDIAPDSLAITVRVKDQPVIAASRGAGAHTVSDLVQTPTRISWTWDNQYTIVCVLDGRDLRLGITTTQAGDLNLIDQPGSAFGKGLIWPRGEGRYVPAGDPVWQDHLAGDDDIDTTQALSLPLWGQDHGAFALTWLLLNPFNNGLSFATEDGGLAVRLKHSFTSLSPQTPMDMLLHLGEDVTAGARRYRNHLIDTGACETLDSKVAKTPEAARLIGASHTYLWGNGLLGPGDVRDWTAFRKTLNGPSDLAVNLRASFEKDSLALLGGKLDAWQQGALIAAVNDALNALARKQWQVDDIDPEVIVATYADLRQQVARIFGTSLSPDPARWGDGLSTQTLASLQKAGLGKLWVGLGDGWEGGLWHPEIVASFAEAGYLIGPYDSYETAIEPGKRPEWATAQLGRDAFENAGVIKKNGSVTAGFQKAGVYTNTVTVMPLLKARVSALAKATRFNSWFLDVYATGMVFDDYQPGHEMTMAQNAAADSEAMRWIGETLQLPIGSEDGNATGARGVLFGHGMQTPVMGWGDPDLQKDTTSPYYLGNWYPSGQPGIFFKTVPLKDTYRTLHFRPEHRLPLYQSVFHGSVIITHHWSYDNLKFSHLPERELAQLLYNVPPLYHLSVGTLKTRLPVMKRQDAFFRPLHEALARKTMDGFAWLSDDHKVQETRFSDGSRLVANFDAAPRQVDGLDLPAVSIIALLAGQAPQTYTVAS